MNVLGRVVWTTGLAMAALAALEAPASADTYCVALPNPVRMVTGQTKNSTGVGGAQQVIEPAAPNLAPGMAILLGGGGDPQELLTIQAVQPSIAGYVQVTVTTKFAHPVGALVGPALQGAYCAPLCASAVSDLSSCVPACPSSASACVPSCASQPTAQAQYCVGPRPPPPPAPPFPAPPPLPGPMPAGPGPMPPPPFPPPPGPVPAPPPAGQFPPPPPGPMPAPAPYAPPPPPGPVPIPYPAAGPCAPPPPPPPGVPPPPPVPCAVAPASPVGAWMPYLGGWALTVPRGTLVAVPHPPYPSFTPPPPQASVFAQASAMPGALVTPGQYVFVPGSTTWTFVPSGSWIASGAIATPR